MVAPHEVMPQLDHVVLVLAVRAVHHFYAAKFIAPQNYVMID
jgi:hypothetical protein